jgi:Aspartyl protease/PDZ domain
LSSCVVYAQPAKPDAKLLETLSFKTYTGSVIIIQAKVDTISTPLNFIFDTGSSGISLDSSTCEEFNLKPTLTDTTLSGIAGSRKVSFVFNKKFKVGNLITDSMNFFVNDYSILNSVYGEKIDGIVGYNFISKYIFNINFDSLKMQIFSKGKVKYESQSTTLKPAISRLAVLPLDIKDKIKSTNDFYFDTGAGLSLMLTENFIAENKFLFTRRKPVVTQVQGLGGKKPMRLTVIKRLKIGPYYFKHVPTDIYDDIDNRVFNKSTIGLIGNDIMRRFNMIINYPQGEINITPNGNFHDLFDYAYTGLSLFTSNNKIYIDDIVAKSPAEKAGLKNGDIVLGVGVSFSGDIQTYEKLLQRVNEQIKVLVSRNDRTFFLSITPISIR